MKYILICLVSLFVFISCKKINTQNNPIVGQWAWAFQTTDSSDSNATPSTTGINEILSFTTLGKYNLIQNGTIVDSGTYKTSITTGFNGHMASSIAYSNARGKDSVSYYILTNNNDSLIFSYGLIGILDEGSRHYGRE